MASMRAFGWIGAAPGGGALTAKGRTPAAAAAAAALPHGPCPIYTDRIDCIAFLIIYNNII
jgi:hypothetical protein